VIVAIVNHKGGVGKSVTAIHLAAYFQQSAPALLIDGDRNRSCLSWQRRGALPFRVIDERQAGGIAQDYKYVVIDTPAAERDDLAALAKGCDLLVIPAIPDAMSLDALVLLVDELRQIGAARFKVLLTLCPPRPSHDADEARAMLDSAGIPVFTGQIRRLAAYQKAALAGVIVSAVHDPRAAAAWNDYAAIGKEITKNHGR
jgi:chromosome partitioning protein